MSAIFETYFSLADIGQRLPKSDKFWRTAVKSGEFGPACVLVGGKYFIPASAVARYLDAHRLGAAPLAALVNGRQRQEPPRGADLSPGVAARSPGELRRKRVQTSATEATDA